MTLAILTPRLQLLPHLWTEAKIQRMVDWLNDAELMRYSEQRHVRHTPESQIDYINAMRIRHQFMEIHHEGEIIGTITATVDKPNGIADIGILIGDRSKQGKGLGQEAWKHFCDYVLHKDGIRKIEAGCMAANIPMRCIATATGMYLEGRRRSHFLLQGIPVDMLHFGRFREPHDDLA